MMKKHTFVICAYKESPYLEKCIQSLKQQILESNIIIVTSTPSVYIESLADKYEIPYLINKGESGITQDWNFGYQCAVNQYQSKYITIAHQDDIYDKNYLSSMLKRVKSAIHPLIAFSDYYEIRCEKKVTVNTVLKIKRLMLLPLKFSLLRRSKWVRRRILSFGSPICCPSVTFVVDNLPRVIFENHYRACEDWEAWEKISKLKGEFLYVPEMLMGHRIHEDSETTSAIGDNKRTLEEYQMFCKFWPKIIAKILSKEYAKSQQSNNVN
ncbi:glycosyltransferase [Mordavella massiliensis]|uniref:Glycosyltransferase n=2 Tax=Mordavella massiliensis TaxID=1871024 RepID=A0A939BFX9_9CLOT|nr:glycosyltransferase [Mordavella massiliensis]MBM6948817.1 glycosyltransferase [Mordavella massiliensis]